MSNKSQGAIVPVLVQLRHNSDSRGDLDALELTALPFPVKRIFLVSRTGGDGSVRGEHAHRECHQLLIAAHGRVHVEVDDGTDEWSFVLADSASGLHIPPGLWGRQRYLDPDAVLVVLASHHYDRSEYIDTRANYVFWRDSLR